MDPPPRPKPVRVSRWERRFPRAPRIDPYVRPSACGSCLGCLSANLLFGHGCGILARSRFASVSLCGFSHVNRSFRSRRRSTFSHFLLSRRINFRRRLQLVGTAQYPGHPLTTPPSQPESSLPRLPAIVREPRKVKRLRPHLGI